VHDIVDDTVAEVGVKDTLLMVGGLLGAVVTVTVEDCWVAVAP
tara:strand:- start:15 stop:143 length:129 start_codon:yes stop_codon:yes gene_type:complete